MKSKQESFFSLMSNLISKPTKEELDQQHQANKNQHTLQQERFAFQKQLLEWKYASQTHKDNWEQKNMEQELELQKRQLETEERKARVEHLHRLLEIVDERIEKGLEFQKSVKGDRQLVEDAKKSLRENHGHKRKMEAMLLSTVK